jgi:hypothetical protein
MSGPPAPEQRPTCSLFYQPSFTPSGLARNLDLEPFDADDLVRRSESLVTYCTAFPRTLQPKQDQTTVVPCDECTYGFSDARSALTCNQSPLCNATEDCKTCQFSPLSTAPNVLVPCDTCISKVCGMNGNCQCVW